MTPVQVLTILVITSLVQTALCVWLYVRVRDLSARAAAPPSDGSGSTGLINALNRRISRLEDRLGAVEVSPAAAGSVGPKRHRRLDRRQQAPVEGPVLIAVPSLASIPVEMSSEVAAEFDRRFGPIWALADAGAPPDAIARETGHPIGQVELILGLRGRGSLPGDSVHSIRDHVDA